MEITREHRDQLILMTIFSENCSSSNRSNVISEPSIPLGNSNFDYDALDHNYEARKWNQEHFHEKKQENVSVKKICEREQKSIPTTSKNIFPLYKSIESPSVGKNFKPISKPSKNFVTTHSSCGINSLDLNKLPLNAIPTASLFAAHADMSVTKSSAIERKSHSSAGLAGDSKLGTLAKSKTSRKNCHQKESLMLPLEKVLKLERSMVYPARPSDFPPHQIKNKPPGCKSVVVSGLPKRISTEAIREIFETCGRLNAIRKMKKNIYQIRFDRPVHAERAIFFSGCRVAVAKIYRPPYYGKMIVNFDNKKIEKKKTLSDDYKRENLQSEADCKERMMKEILMPSTPSPVVPFSFGEVKILCKQLKSEKTFTRAASVLISWLEKGACNKLNSASFYLMLASINNYVVHLMNEKAYLTSEATEAKMLLKKQMQSILLHLKEILKVFNAACMQSAWDHFTDKQKRSIESWKKEVEEINQAYVKEVLNDPIEDKMDVVENEVKSDETLLKKNEDICEAKDKYKDEWNKLRLEISILRCQLEAAENDKIVLQTENNELESERRRVQALNGTLQDLTKRIKVLSEKRSSDAELEKYRTSKSSKINDDNESDLSKSNGKHLDFTNMNASVFKGEARLIGLVSTFLLVHPCSSTESICSYLRQVNSKIMPKQVKVLLDRYPAIFRADSTGIGENLAQKWSFVGLPS